ncbi:MAG TPA: CHAT domain-containing protein [Thermoanaerobaculia bacterium]|nr:CHAT domain-containing protein [Thermoanaerobaculia bacterium]
MMIENSPTDLLFSIEPGEEIWTITGPTPDSPPHVVSNPLGDTDLLRLVSDLRSYSGTKISRDRRSELRSYVDLARQVAERLTPLLLSEEARRLVQVRLNQVQRGRALLTIRVADRGLLGDRVLALPWEALAPDQPNEFPVRESRLEIVRESVAPGAPEIPEPSGPLSVAVAVAAPEGQVALSYEKEEIRLQTALAPLGHAVAFSDLGTLDDLVELVDAHRATAILFSGHGLPGRLLFENRLGFAEPVAIDEIVRRLRTVLLDPGRSGSFPDLFFLSACDSATSLRDDGPSAAAALHRAGFPQVIGYFGPVRDSAATRAEETFFRELARDATALHAAHRARASLVDVFEHEGKSFVFPLAWTQLAIYHRGADRRMAAGGRKAGRFLPPRFRRRSDDARGLPILVQGFVGRRGLQHEILRRVEEGERLIVLQGLGGSGKTALAGHLMTRRLALSSEPAGALFISVPSPDETPEPVPALRLRAEEHGRRHALPAWEERIVEIRERFPMAAAGFAATVRALQAARPEAPFALCIDRLDALQSGPGISGGPGAWRPGGEELWREIQSLAEGGILVLATTRYAGADLPVRSHIAMPPLSESDAYRMMAFFVELADLAPKQRLLLADWADGHPRTIELLDGAVAGQMNAKGLGWELTDAWKELVEPALPGVAEAVCQETRLDELWEGLPESAREHARRIAAARKPLPLAGIDRLGGERDALIRCGLLVRHRKEVRREGLTAVGLEWIERWGLPRRLRERIAGGGGHG